MQSKHRFFIRVSVFLFFLTITCFEIKENAHAAPKRNVKNIFLQADFWKNATADDVKKALKRGIKATAYTKDFLSVLALASMYIKDPAIISLLIDAGAKINGISPRGPLQTPLHMACRHNPHSAIILGLLKAEANIHAQDTAGATPYHYAGKGTKNPAILDILRKHGAQVKAQDEYGNTALMWAGMQNPHAQVMRHLIAQAKPTSKELQATFAELVSHENVPAVLGALLQGGLSVNARGFGKETPLMYMAFSATTSQDMKLLQYLLSHGADIHAKDMLGNTALHHGASRTKNDSVIDALIYGGADINNRNIARQTPLMLASASNSKESIIEKLLFYGAKLQEQDSHGRSALFYAAMHNSNPGIILRFMQKGMDLTITDKKGRTPFFLAVQKNKNPEMIKGLAQLGARVNVKDKAGNTPLILAAAFNESPQIITALVGIGANIHAQNSQGRTALMRAAINTYNADILTQLIRLGANIKDKDNKGRTALTYAQWNWKVAKSTVVKYMEKQIAKK